MELRLRKVEEVGLYQYLDRLSRSEMKPQKSGGELSRGTSCHLRAIEDELSVDQWTIELWRKYEGGWQTNFH